MPSVVRKDLDSTNAILTVNVFRDDIKPKIDAELKKFRQKAQIKGFRQGQAPMPFIKKMYGTSLFAETLDKMFSDELFGYIRESKLDVLGQPMPAENQERFSSNLDKMEDVYAVNYEIGHVPTFELKGLDGSESFEQYTLSNLAALAEEDLEFSLKRMGEKTNVFEDIKGNDIVKIEAKEIGGDGFENTFTVLIDAMPNNALKADLLTKKAGDTIKFNARDVDKFTDDAKFRKYILQLESDDIRVVGDMFEGIIEEVSRVAVAELNEEFYQKYFGGAVSTREEALEVLKTEVANYYKVRTNALLMRDVQKKLLDLNPTNLPDAFLKRWLKATNETLDEATIDKEYPAFADNLRWTLVRDKIKDQFDVFVTQEEIQGHFANQVRAYFKMNLPDEMIISSVDRLMQNKEDVEKVQKELETDKIFQAIIPNVKLTDVAISSEELNKIIDKISAVSEVEQSADATLVDALS
jgi:trigger factor